MTSLFGKHDFDFLVFPRPKPRYTLLDDRLHWIPRESFPEVHRVSRSSCDKIKEAKISEEFIPALLYSPSTSVSTSISKIIVYFHGNGEDASATSKMMKEMATFFNAFVLVVEYPGYGVYSGQPSEDSILQDARAIFDFLTLEKGVNPNEIIVIGRSLGSGPASHLAKIRRFGALVLVSPFLSIKHVASSTFSWFGEIIKDRFNNVENIKKNKNALLVIHGKKDTMIPFSQGSELAQLSQGVTGICFNEEMTHNSFSLWNDIIFPISGFLELTKNPFGSETQKKSSPVCFDRHFHLKWISSSRCSRNLMKTASLTEKIRESVGDVMDSCECDITDEEFNQIDGQCH